MSTRLPQHTIYRCPSDQRKRQAEAAEITPLLLELETHVPLHDVAFGSEPPDFVLTIGEHTIGAELTELLPKPFPRKGYERKAAFHTWQKEVKETPLPQHSFDWGKFSTRESLTAFEQQLQRKGQHLAKWKGGFKETWLIMHVGSGSALGALVPSRNNPATGHEAEVQNWIAKIACRVVKACRSSPFDCVIFFAGRAIRAFPKINSHNLPMFAPDIVEKGASVSDIYLDWSTSPRTIVKHPYIEDPSVHREPNL